MATNVIPPLVWDGSRLSIPRASATQDGYLSHDDFIFFSGGTVVPVTSFNTRTGEVILLEDDVLAALGYTPLNKHGDTMTGPLTLSGAPSLPLHAATRGYVDSHSGSGVAAMPGEYPVSDFNGSGSKLKFTGTIASGTLTRVTLTAASDFAVGQGIFIANAGGSGQPLITTVDAIDATLKIITLHVAATAAVTSVNVQHDDTVAIQAAIDACYAAGGGTVLFDDMYGFYRINKGFSDINSILKIPFTPWITGSAAGPPPPMVRLKGNGNNVAAVFTPAPTLGPIIQTDLVGANSSTAMLSSASYIPGSAFSGCNQMTVAIEGLTFRTYDNPNICGIEMGMLWNLYLKDVLVDTGMPAESNTPLGGTLPGGSQPTHGTFGIRLPRINACTVVDTNNVAVANYGIGIIGSELWHCNNTWVIRCGTGVQTHETYSNYPITGTLLIVQCTTGLEFLAAVPVDLHVEFETNAGGWWSAPPGKFIYDPLNVASGVVKYVVINSDIGGSVAISTTGLAGVSLWSLGAFGVHLATNANIIAHDIDVRNVTVRGALNIFDGLALQPLSVGVNDSAATDYRQVQVPNGSGMAGLLTGLVSYWTMDQTSGNRLDTLGTNPLPIFGADLSDTGRVGTAVRGAGGTYCLRPDHTSQHFAGSFTIAGWVYPEVVTASIATILSKWGFAGTREFALMYNGFTPSVQFLVSRDGTGSSFAELPGALLVNTWNFIVGWFDASDQTVHVQLNNGTPVSSTVTGTGPIFAGTADLCSLFYGDGSFNAFTSGRIDEVGMWSRVLTPTERTHLFAGVTYPF